MRIDAHHHVWDLSVRDQPWTAGLAPLQRSFGLPDLTPELAGHGIGATIVVQTVCVAHETPELLTLAGADSPIVGVVGWVDLTAEDVGDQLARLRAMRGGSALVGIRHQVQGERDPNWLTRSDVLHGLAAVAAAGLAYDLIVTAEQLPAAVAAAQRVPELRFVLDHGGKPAIAAGVVEPWRSAVRVLAAEPNVAVKLSGLVTAADRERWRVEDLRPYADTLFEAFGPDRVMFGSDWPVCLLAGSYDDVITAAEALTFGLSNTEYAQVFGGSASHWYGLPVMNRIRLGRTDVGVSRLGFGAAPIGNLYTAIDDQAAVAAVDAAWAGGVRYFDTAPHYGLGLSERRLGMALAGRPRGEFVVSTKVGRLLVANPAPVGTDLGAGGFAVPDTMMRRRDYSRDGVRASIEASLARLGVDRIDLVFVHDPEDFMDDAIGLAAPALAELRDEGVIGAFGAGMNFVEPLRRFVAETDADAVMVAGRWTLVDRSAETLLAECAERGVSVVAAAPFNSGLLARDWPPADAHFDYGPVPPDVLARARAIATVCRGHDATLPHAAMQFPLQHPAVACVVAGMRTAAQATQGAAWLADPVPATVWESVERECG